MDSQIDIRRLLKEYYSGTATPDEIRIMVDYFADNHNVDADLIVDREMFLALKEASEVEVPARLTRAVADIGRPTRRFMVYQPWLSIAASVAVIFVLVTVLFTSAHSDDNVADVDIVLSRPSVKPVEPIMDAPASDAHEHHLAAVQKEEKSSVPANPAPIRSSSRKVKPSSAPVKRARPSSISKERKAANRTVELLNRSLSKVNLAYSGVEASFEEIDNTFNDMQ